MRPLFILTMLVCGCGEEVAANPDMALEACPAEEPESGSPCNGEASYPACNYPETCFNLSPPATRNASCVDGQWQVARILRPVLCPLQAPADGAFCCDHQPSPCDYQCGSGTVRATCDQAREKWSTVGAIDPSCTLIVPDGGIR